MPEQDDLLSRFDKVDQAVARQIERRRRSLRLYWLLLIAAVVMALLGLWYGSTLPEAIVKDPALRQDVASSAADSLRNDPEFGKDVASSAADSLRNDPTLRQDVASSAADALRGDPAFGEGVARSFLEDPENLGKVAAAAVSSPDFSDLLAGESKRTLAAVSLGHASVRKDVDAKVEALARQLAAANEQLEVQGGELARLSRELKDLEGRQEIGWAPRSFLLKEGGRDTLPGFGFTIQLGRRVREGGSEGIDGVRVFDADEEVYPGQGRAPATVRFGEPFSFSARGDRFQAVLSNAQHRLFVSDWVSLDVGPMPGGSRPPDS